MKVSVYDRNSVMREALQFSVRSSNLDLCKTAFEYLWENDQKWLIWKTPFIVAKEILYLLEYIPLAHVCKKDLLRFYYKLCILPKTNDVSALILLMENDLLDTLDETKSLALVCKESSRDILFNSILDIFSYVSLTQDENRIINKLGEMVNSCGTRIDFYSCIFATFLVLSRRYNKKEIDKEIKKKIKEWSKDSKSPVVTDDIPYCVFGINTDLWKVAKKVFNARFKDVFSYANENTISRFWDVYSAFYAPSRSVSDDPSIPFLMRTLFMQYFVDMCVPKEILVEIPQILEIVAAKRLKLLDK